MTHAPVLTAPTRVERRRRSAGTKQRPTVASALSQARRDQNRKQLGVAAYLRCECDAPECRATCPAAAESHRGLLDRFIVTPGHLGASTVVRVADRFFVVEPSRAGRR